MNASNLYPADHHPARIRKVEKMFESTLDFTDLKVLKRYSQNSKKELHQRQYFWLWKQVKYIMYTSKKTFKWYVDLLAIGEKHYVFMKDSKTFMYDCILIRERKKYLLL